MVGVGGKIDHGVVGDGACGVPVTKKKVCGNRSVVVELAKFGPSVRFALRYAESPRGVGWWYANLLGSLGGNWQCGGSSWNSWESVGRHALEVLCVLFAAPPADSAVGGGRPLPMAPVYVLRDCQWAGKFKGCIKALRLQFCWVVFYSTVRLMEMGGVCNGNEATTKFSKAGEGVGMRHCSKCGR